MEPEQQIVLEPAWTPQLGPQLSAITADWCEELFFGGAKFGGKTDLLLGDFLQDVPKYEQAWHGIFLRTSLPDLHKAIQRSHELFPLTGARWGEQKKQWTWPNRATLRFRPLPDVREAFQYDGHEYPFIAFDELPQWITDECYKRSISWNRWGGCLIPTKRIRSTGNPGGYGDDWVQEYFKINSHPLGYEVFINEDTKRKVMFIPSKVRDNVIGLKNNPSYIHDLKGVGSPELVLAWLEGDWTAMSKLGIFFPEFRATGEHPHVILPFRVPKHWLRFGAFDWGSAAPFYFGWYAVSDGTPVGTPTKSFPKGAIIQYRELYGADRPNEGLKIPVEDIAQMILSMMDSKEKLTYSVADPSIFAQDGGPSRAERMANAGLIMKKGDNKREGGWDQVRGRLVGKEGVPMLYFYKTCPDIIRTLPRLRHDLKKPEDCITTGDDHGPDTLRYGLMSRPWMKKYKKLFKVGENTLNNLWKQHERTLKSGGYFR